MCSFVSVLAVKPIQVQFTATSTQAHSSSTATSGTTEEVLRAQRARVLLEAVVEDSVNLLNEATGRPVAPPQGVHA